MAAETGATVLSQTEQIANLTKLVEQLNHNIDQMKAPVWQKYQAYEMARYDDQIALMHAREQLYSWQNFASNVMMWTAVIVVLAGLVMSAAQLRQAMKLSWKTDGSVEISAQGLKITSSIVGILILGLSIAFILIFVDQVYTIHDPNTAAATATHS